MTCSRLPPSIAVTTAVLAIRTRITWSRPSLLKELESAVTPWISCALIIPVRSSRTVSGASPSATRRRDRQSATARIAPRLSDG
jgi:hypothetical protein